MQYDYTTPEGRIAALREINSLLSTYTDETGRPAVPDAILYDTLIEREADYGSGASYTVKSADEAMRALDSKGVTLSISGYFWDAIHDQVSDLLDEHGLVDTGRRCESCGADISEYDIYETQCVICTGEAS